MRAGKSEGLKASPPGPRHSGPSENVEARPGEKVGPMKRLLLLLLRLPQLAAGTTPGLSGGRIVAAAAATAAHQPLIISVVVSVHYRRW